MAKQDEKEELKRVLAQIKKEERAERTKASENAKAPGNKGKSGGATTSGKGNRDAKQSEPEEKGWVKAFRTGFPAMILDSVLLFLGTFIFSVIYKAVISGEFSMGQDSSASMIYYVSPVFGMLGILLLFILKNVYDVRFYRIQRAAKEEHKKLLRVNEWTLYVMLMIALEVFTFITFSCGRNFFDTYTFENAVLGNVAYTMLYIVMPLLYPIQAIVRLIFRHMEKEEKE